MRGHTNAILDLQVNGDGSKIFTGSADKSIMIWDCEENKRIKKIKGHSAIVNSISASKRGLE